MGMRNVRTLTMPLALGFALCTISVAPVVAQNPASVSEDEFASLEWLEGRWVGTGGEAGTFYEQYRRLDDGTIEVTTFADSNFTRQQSRSTIQRVGGFVMMSGGEGGQSIVTRMQRESIRFEWAGSDRPGYSWNKVSDDEWVAVMDRRDQAPVVYNMRRVSDAG